MIDSGPDKKIWYLCKKIFIIKEFVDTRNLLENFQCLLGYLWPGNNISENVCRGGKTGS